MKFLHDYPTLERLAAHYPGIKFATNLSVLTSDNTVNALGGVPSNFRNALLQKYPPGEVLFGLRILFGVGKGSNRWYDNSLVLNNGVILKYGVGGDDPPSRLVQNRIVRCVRLARQMAYKAWLVTQLSAGQDLEAVIRISYPDLVQTIFSHHFRMQTLKPETVGRISGIYKNIYAGLSNHIVIADYSGDGNTVGNVHTKLFYNDKLGSFASPFQTLKIGGKKQQEWRKSLEQFPQEIIRELANERGIEPTIDALIRARMGNIQIDFDEVENGNSTRWTDLGIATIIIHEASHKFGNARDHAYCHQLSKYKGLGSECRVGNADSFAYAAASLHNGSLIKGPSDKAIIM